MSQKEYIKYGPLVYATDYFGTTKSDINTANKAFAAKQNEIGKALHGDNGNKDTGL